MIARPDPASLREFLPAVLELSETPASPAGRLTLWVMMALIVSLLTWAVTARIAVVAVAPGHVMPPGQARPVQAFEPGRVAALLVADGDRVSAGQGLLELDRSVAESDLRIALHELRRAERLAPIQRQRLESGERLLAAGHLPRADYLTLQERGIASEHELAAARQRVRKARERVEWQTIRAPVSGTVQQRVPRSVGDVVQPGAALLVVIPEGEDLEVEARLANRDRGFVRPGQAVTVKADAFPFTRFGSLAGAVVRVSEDAAGSAEQGSWYALRVRLPDTVLRGEGFAHRLAPGMTVSVDVDTGERRVIEYFLGPLMQRVSESAKER